VELTNKKDKLLGNLSYLGFSVCGPHTTKFPFGFGFGRSLPTNLAFWLVGRKCLLFASVHLFPSSSDNEAALPNSRASLSD
jgi:hypothetical protein